MNCPRVRDLGISVGELPTGVHNAITDVAGVRVGHTTLIAGEGALQPGHGPVRTGVTVILPHGDDLFRHKVHAAVHTINGFGKPFGFEQVRELGVIESPIALTNTLNVGLVADALVQYAIRQNPDIGIRTASVNVVVGETNDGWLNDLQGRHVRAEHVWAAIESASSGPADGRCGRRGHGHDLLWLEGRHRHSQPRLARRRGWLYAGCAGAVELGPCARPDDLRRAGGASHLAQDLRGLARPRRSRGIKAPS